MNDVTLEGREIAPGVWRTFAPGLYPDLPNEEYQKGEGTSKSHLDDIAAELGMTPHHYWHTRLDPNRVAKPKTEALILGDAIHKAILEPDLFSTNFVELPGDAPARPTAAMLKSKNPSANSMDRVSWWADFQAEHGEKIALKSDDYLMVTRMRDAVYAHPTVRKNNLLVGGNVEQSFYAIDPETGALIKCRTDYETLERDARIIDVKSTDDASPEGFAKSVYKYRYDVQNGWYPHVIRSAFEQQVEVRSFIFIAIEKEWPHAIGIHWLDPEDIATGLVVAKRDLRLIESCKASNEWPDFGCAPGQLRRINRKV